MNEGICFEGDLLFIHLLQYWQWDILRKGRPYILYKSIILLYLKTLAWASLGTLELKM